MANKREKSKKPKQKPAGNKGGGAGFTDVAANTSPKKQKKKK